MLLQSMGRRFEIVRGYQSHTPAWRNRCTTDGASALMPAVRRFFDDWSAAMASPPDQARREATQAVADYEGAILRSRVYDGISFFDRAGERALALVSAAKPAPGRP